MSTAPPMMMGTNSEWDLVDEAGDQSFPASDPPARTAPSAEAPSSAPPVSVRQLAIGAAVLGSIGGAVLLLGLIRHLRA